MYKNRTRTIEELRILQALSLELKLMKTEQRIREFIKEFGEEGVYLSFSGGKDSTVLNHIIKNMGYNIELVYIDTGLEYPEIRQFAKDNNCIFIKPDIPFNIVIKKYGYPLFSKEVAKNIYYGRKAIEKNDYDKINRYIFGVRYKNGIPYKYGGLSKKAIDITFDTDIPISSMCCDKLKKDPSKKYEKYSGKHPFIATLTEESDLREKAWLQNGCNAFNAKRITSNPLSFWKEQDILQYIYENNIKICEVYGEVIKENDQYKLTGVKRTGCIFCLFGIHREKSPNRMELLKLSHPELYNYCIEKLGYKQILDYLDIPY